MSLPWHEIFPEGASPLTTSEPSVVKFNKVNKMEINNNLELAFLLNKDLVIRLS